MKQKPFASKKFIAMFIGVCFTIIFTITALIFIAFVPAVAPDIVNLITVSLATVNGLVSLYAIGQSAVDWKNKRSPEE